MKKFLLLAFISIYCIGLHAQNYRLTWGEEIKLKKGTADLDVISADKIILELGDRRALCVREFRGADRRVSSGRLGTGTGARPPPDG